MRINHNEPLTNFIYCGRQSFGYCFKARTFSICFIENEAEQNQTENPNKQSFKF